MNHVTLYVAILTLPASDLPWIDESQRPSRQVDNCAAVIPSGGSYKLSKRQCSSWAEILCETGTLISAILPGLINTLSR